MERPTILDLQFLLSRLTEGAEFGFRELEILERTTYGLHQPGFISSEMANLSNQIWLVFGQQGQQYLPALSYLITNFHYPGTRLMALGTLADRVNRSWSAIDESNRNNIKQYIVCLINDTVAIEPSNERDTLLARANEVLVAMLKHEWTGLFKDFIANMLEEEETPTAKMINNFNILTLLLHEGLDSWDGNMTASEAETFRNSIDEDMRHILKIACRVLQNKFSVDRRLLISRCLQMLGETMECMPAYELFNCNLIELLLELLEQRQFEKQLQRCFESVFNFRERASSNENHSKIARKLLLVLEVFLTRHEERSRPVSHADKQSTSTLDSFDERRVSSRRETAHQLSVQVLELMYQFLCRYVPYMDRTPEQNDVEVEFDGFTKIHFSKELYESIIRIYWKMVGFLNRFISLYVKFNLSPEEDEEAEEKQFKVIECAKYVLVLAGKLKIPPQAQLSILVEQLLLGLTPISKEFSKFYLSFGLIINAGVTYSECRSFSSESSSQFAGLMEVVMKDPKLTKIYADIIENQLQSIKKIENVDTHRGKLENIPPKDLKSLNSHSQSEMQSAINTVNRLTWNMVIAFSVNELHFEKIPINSYINSFIKKTQTLDISKLLLKKCYSLNSKYLMMAYPLTLTLASLRSAVFGCLQTTKNDLMNEYLILMLSKMLTNPQFGVQGIDGIEMKLLIQKTHEVEKSGVHAEQLIRIYPAFFCFFLKKIATDNAKDNTVKALTQLLIEKEKDDLQAFAKQETIMTEGPDIKRCLLYFAKLSSIAAHLIGVANSPEASSVKGLNFLIKNHINMLRETMKLLEYKYFLYSSHLKGQTRQNFENSNINQFRCAYNALVCDNVELTIIKTRLQAPNPDLGSHEKRKLLIEQRSNYIGRCWETLSKDFHEQTEFKCDQYLSLAVRYYRWLIYIKHAHANEIINHSITQICSCLNQESCQKYEYLNLKKYVYWKEVVELFLFNLTDDNCQQLMRVFEEVSNECVNLSATNVQTVLELQQLVFVLLNDHCEDDFQKEPAVWSFIISIFKNTFADLFTYTKNQNFFKRISQIFHQQIVFASQWNRPIFRDPREQQGKSNQEVLFLYLQNFVVNNVPMSNIEQEQHNDLLLRLFKEKKESIFVDRVRDYVISINRMVANVRKLSRV